MGVCGESQRLSPGTLCKAEGARRAQAMTEKEKMSDWASCKPPVGGLQAA